MNYPTGSMNLARVDYNQAISHEELIGKYCPRASGLSRSNLQKETGKKHAISPYLPHHPSPTDN